MCVHTKGFIRFQINGRGLCYSVIDYGVRVFAVTFVDPSSAYRIEGCVVMVCGFTAHPGRKKQARMSVRRRTRRENEVNDRREITHELI
jgi:hypothetical protein